MSVRLSAPAPPTLLASASLRSTARIACGLTGPSDTAITRPRKYPSSSGRVLDGDTFVAEIRVWFSQAVVERVRIAGIDAPEIKQPHGTLARSALERKVGHRRVAVESRGYDKHGRLLGKLWLDERDVCREMVAEGHAWASGRIAPDPDLVDAESLARRERRGLWAEASPEEPSQWRAAHPRVP